MIDLVIIGAGVSGETAAILAARSGLRAVLVEHTDRMGRKILSTGNGRCNFANEVMDSSCYRSDTPDFLSSLLSRYHTEDILRFYESIGIEPKNRNGYYYPASGQASSVQKAFSGELEFLGVRIMTGCRVKRVSPLSGKGFLVNTDKGDLEAKTVLLSTGSKAFPVSGSDGSGYELARKLGHRIIEPLPALVQLRSREKHFKQLSGVRVDGEIRLLIEEEEIARDTGEIQMTDYGISGIPVFQVSRYAARALYQGKEVTAMLDFAPGESEEDTKARIRRRLALPGMLPENLLSGWLPEKLSILLLEIARIRRLDHVSGISDRQKEILFRLIRSFRTDITGTNSFPQAQVCSGGVDVKEVNPETMESRLVRGLYFAGEILDVDGICGGYNLSFAVMSAMAAVEGIKNRH